MPRRMPASISALTSGHLIASSCVFSSTSTQPIAGDRTGSGGGRRAMTGAAERGIGRLVDGAAAVGLEVDRDRREPGRGELRPEHREALLRAAEAVAEDHRRVAAGRRRATRDE